MKMQTSQELNLLRLVGLTTVEHVMKCSLSNVQMCILCVIYALIRVLLVLCT